MDISSEQRKRGRDCNERGQRTAAKHSIDLQAK
jgi:hypothetical protein